LFGSNFSVAWFGLFYTSTGISIDCSFESLGLLSGMKSILSNKHHVLQALVTLTVALRFHSRFIGTAYMESAWR